MASRGTTLDALFHITDWLPTLVSASGIASLKSRPHLPLDGHDLWKCLLGDKSACTRTEVVANLNTVCDGTTDEEGEEEGGEEDGKDVVDRAPRPFRTECPAPKAALRVGDLKLLVECYNATSHTFTGTIQLYNLSADVSEMHDLSQSRPSDVATLSARLLSYAKDAAMIPPLSDRAPWQGESYYCAKCEAGRPVVIGAKGSKTRSWEPWCDGPAGVPCLPP